ncbi:hypothetical protein P9W82_12220, partial [Bacillus cereus]|nr:hypothetical protein [Bacillus cereus]
IKKKIGFDFNNTENQKDVVHMNLPKNQILYGPPHAHQLKNLHYPQVSKNVILSKKLARKDDIFYESFNSR